MREHPIIFSAPMIPKILDGSKTQTRRAMKTQPTGSVVRSPYGVPGDRLWVSERVSVAMVRGDEVDLVYQADNTNDRKPLPARIKRPPVGPYRGRVIPREWSRMLLEITDLRVQRLQEISEADAIAEGFDQETCQLAFDHAAGRIETRDACYVEDEDGGSAREDDLCDVCVVKRKLRTGQRVHNEGHYARESDGPAYCGKCGHPILLSLTEYGIERELRIEDDPLGKHPELFPVHGGDARILELVAGGTGDLQEKHLGRLAQIGFATYWNSLNAKRGFAWDANPCVWVPTFKAIEQGSKQ